MSFSFLFVNLSGQFYFVEAGLAFGLLMTISRLPFRPRLGWGLAATLSIWALGSILSDLAVSNDLLNVSKGLLRILFLAVDIWALYYLCDCDLRAIRIVWVGLAISGVLSFWLQPNAYARDSPWKFAFAIPVSIVVVLWLSRRDRSRRFSSSVLLSLAAVHFLLGFRSLSIVILVAALLLLVRAGQVHSRKGKSILVRIRPIILAMIGVIALVALSTAYDSLAESGTFGYEAQQKAAYQATGQFGSLFSSRSEFLLSFLTIASNPVLGGGTESVASLQDAQSAGAVLNDLGYANVARALNGGSPAYHSEILGSWAQNGILAMPFWLTVLCLLVLAAYAVVYRETRLPELVAFLAVLGAWDLLFSPFGADRRMWVAATVVTIVACSTRSQRRVNGQDINRDDQL